MVERERQEQPKEPSKKDEMSQALEKMAWEAEYGPGTPASKEEAGAAKEISEKEKMLERVDNLRKTDNSYQDSIHDLAEKEYKSREELIEKFRKNGLNPDDYKDLIGDIANDKSTETLRAIENEKGSETDQLTGLRNKRGYETQIPQLLSMEKRSNHACSMLVIDFDHFKNVNDEYGHGAGDEVLKIISAIMKDTVRASDIIFRYGGEEFVVFLPSTDSKQAESVAEKIRAEVEKATITVTDSAGKKVNLRKTISVGCVGTNQLPDWKKYDTDNSGKFLGKMFSAADKSAYKSKLDGRNRVTGFKKKFLTDKSLVEKK